MGVVLALELIVAHRWFLFFFSVEGFEMKLCFLNAKKSEIWKWKREMERNGWVWRHARFESERESKFS